RRDVLRDGLTAAGGRTVRIALVVTRDQGDLAAGNTALAVDAVHRRLRPGLDLRNRERRLGEAPEGHDLDRVARAGGLRPRVSTAATGGERESSGRRNHCGRAT